MTFEPETKEISGLLFTCAPAIGVLSEEHAKCAAVMQACAERLDAQAALIEQQAKEIEVLRKAITWALGEGPDNFGMWFEPAAADKTRYWWRAILRKQMQDALTGQ